MRSGVGRVAREAGNERVSGVFLDVDHRIEEFAAQQGERRAPVKEDVMERIGENLADPDDAGEDVLQEEEMDHSEGDTSDAHEEPDQAEVVKVTGKVGCGMQGSEEGWGDKQKDGCHCPAGHQDDFSPEVVSDLDLFLMLVGDLVDLVVVVGFEEEVSRLTGGHRDSPSDQSGCRGVDEQESIGDEKAQCADEVQSLVDSGLVIESMIVPALDPQGFEIRDGLSHRLVSGRM